MHEYYDGETGEGISNEGFQSWDMLINKSAHGMKKEKQYPNFSQVTKTQYGL